MDLVENQQQVIKLSVQITCNKEDMCKLIINNKQNIFFILHYKKSDIFYFAL